MSNNQINQFDQSYNQINLNDTIHQPQQSNQTIYIKRKQKPKLNKIQINQIKPQQLKQKIQQTLSIPSSTQLPSSDHNRFTAIKYKSYDTTKFNRQFDKFEELDKNFYRDIKHICDKNKNILGNILALTDDKHNQLSDQQCDQIDYIARKHYKANRISQACMIQNNKQKKSPDKCPCGCEKYRGKTLSLKASISQLQFLGSGAILIFMFIKTYAIVMILTLMIYGVFALTTNLLGGTNKQSYKCTDQWCRFINNSANNNKIEPHPLMIVQWWLGLAFCIIWLIVTRFVKFYGRKKNVQIDRNLVSASDTAIIVRNLPQGQYTETQVLQYFQKLWLRLKREYEAKQSKNNKNQKTNLFKIQENGNNFNIQSIQIIYSMQFARNIIQKIIDLCRQLQWLIEIKVNKNSKNYAQHRLIKKKDEYCLRKQELIEYLQILGDLRNKFLFEQNFRKQISSQLCIIQFKTEEDKDQLVKYFGKQKVGILTQVQQNIKNCFIGKTQNSLMFKGKYLNIQRAPEPSDIQWKKCQKSYSLKKTLILYGLTFVTVIVSLGIMLALDRLQQYVDHESTVGNLSKQSSILSIINIITSIMLLLVNKFLWFSLAYLIESQVNYTLSQRINSHMNKALFATSINIILLPIITNYVFKSDVFSTKGLTGIVFDYQISTLFIGLPLKLFNPVQIIKRIALYVRFSRNWIIRYFCLELNITQENQQKGIKSINKLYQGQTFDVAEYYVYILGTIFHSVFFCQIQPAVLITGTLITSIFYFVLKAKLFYFCNRPQMLDLLVFQTGLSQAGLVPLIYGAGAISLAYIENQVYPDHPNQYHQGVICMILGAIFFFNPGNIFNRFVQYCIECFSKIDILKKKPKADKGVVRNMDTYYKNSNALQLLGYEKVLKANHLDQNIQRQLQKFCHKFLPTRIQKVVHKMQQQQNTTNFGYDKSTNQN